DNGRDDLVTVNDHDVSVLMRQSDDSFIISTQFEGSRFNSLALGAFTSNGLLDLVLTSTVFNSVVVAFSQGNGVFANTLSASVDLGPVAVAVANLNKDSNLDLVTADSAGNAVTVAFNPGSRLTSVSPENGATIRHDPLVKDFDGDGRADTVILKAN